MIIAVSGTPGAGKTAVSKELAQRLGYGYVDVNAAAAREDVETENDPERDTEAVDVDSLVDALRDEVGEDAVVDGHLAHHFPADLTVVLRCRPDELERRLEEKGWSEDKIRENVEAETLDLILQRAAASRETVMEVDTTGKEAEEVAETVANAVETGEVPAALRPGHVTWPVEEYLQGDA